MSCFVTFAGLKIKKMRRIFFVFMMMAVPLAGGGCTSVLRDDPQIVASPDKVSLMLAQAADKASVALETLAAVEYARTPSASVGPIENAPPELRRAMTLSWVGPVEPLTKMMADRAGYGYMTLGAEPPVPMVVSVNVENTPIIDILRSVGLQMGTRANLRVDSENKVIEVQYGPGMDSAEAALSAPDLDDSEDYSGSADEEYEEDYSSE